MWLSLRLTTIRTPGFLNLKFLSEHEITNITDPYSNNDIGKSPLIVIVQGPRLIINVNA